MTVGITLAAIDQLRGTLYGRIRATPTIRCDQLMPSDTNLSVFAKMELWQITGSFKARGALANVLALSEEQRAHGVTAVSAGNHAIATAYAAHCMNLDAKMVMLRSASPIRVRRCEAYGAQVVSAADVHSAFAEVEDIVRREGRAFIHPFEGLTTATATAGVGRELTDAVDDLDAVIVPIGGGGLAAGVAAAVKLSQPGCRVIGVEPTGADSMSRSFAAGSPQTLERVETIADSLGAPMAMPVSYAICKQYLDSIVTVEDHEIAAAMRSIHDTLSLVVEPACASALAALRGPLRDMLSGKRVGLIFCGSNIDIAQWREIVGC